MGADQGRATKVADYILLREQWEENFLCGEIALHGTRRNNILQVRGR